jgi:RHS repeat-associated protein
VRECGDDVDRAYRWDALGRLVEVEDAGRVTHTDVDALGELAAVDGAPLLWDSADPFSPLAWVDGQAILAPWATAGAERDPFGAPAAQDAQLGYRGELEVARLTWLRARPYDPSTRGFLAPDPLPAVAGTAYAGNPYHYAGNDPFGRVDPLGLRPVSEQELREIRDRMGQNFFSRNADYIVAGALIVGGIAVMATGVGGPLGAAMIGGALLSAGADAGIQKFTTGHVNYGEVAVSGLIGAAAGGLGYGAGALVSGGSKVAAVGRGALAGGVESVTGGAANRGLHGRDPFDPAGMATDLVLGGGIGAVGGRLGARSAEAVDAGPGTWRPATESMSDRAAAYQAQIGGRSGMVYDVGGVKFDAYVDGALTEAKGPGYATFVRGGRFMPWFRGADALASQGQRQLAVAGETPIRWAVAEPEATTAIRALFRSRGISGIDVTHVPPH